LNLLYTPHGKGKTMGVKIRINKGKFYLDIHVNGKRTWESLHLSVSTEKKQSREIMAWPKYAGQNGKPR
jgi:hypothetical protein